MEMTKRNIYVVSGLVAVALLAVGFLVGSAARVGSCDCCDDCQALGLYWTNKEPKPKPKPCPGPKPCPTACSWKDGPMPSGTYMWGAVQLKGDKTGFRFADFCGSYVKLPMEKNRRVEAAEIVKYNNCLTCPSETGSPIGAEAPAK